MTTLSISKKEARTAYKNADSNGKELLENLFGKDVFSEKITDRIETLADALEETGRPSAPAFNDVPEDLRSYFQAQYKAIVIAEALNEGQKIDYKNCDQKKWIPWFNTISPSGFAFDDAYYEFTNLRIRMQVTQLTYAQDIFKDKQPRLLAKNNFFKRCW